MNFKKSFSVLELIFVLVLLAFLPSFIIPNIKSNELKLASNRLILYLKQTQLQAYSQNFYSTTSSLWHKKRWTLKFYNCRSSVGGIYYVIFSDKNFKGHPSANESLKDPLTKKPIYSSNACKSNNNFSKYVLLTQQYNISQVDVSCNSTSSIGQISFGSDGRVYSKNSNLKEKYYSNEVKKPCIIKLIHKNGQTKELKVNPRTGYIEII